jgi:hypothetical protein
VTSQRYSAAMGSQVISENGAFLVMDATAEHLLTAEIGLGKVPETHSVGSVGDHNLGVFAITKIALKITDTVPPTHFLSGAPNTGDGDL